jgi:hypothetical protein
MSRIIKIWAKLILATPGKPETFGAPIYWKPFIYLKEAPNSGLIRRMPVDGQMAYFIEAWKDECDNEYIKIIYEDFVGWMLLEHIEKIMELDMLPNGDIVYKRAYPYEDQKREAKTEMPYKT